MTISTQVLALGLLAACGDGGAADGAAEAAGGAHPAAPEAGVSGSAEAELVDESSGAEDLPADSAARSAPDATAPAGEAALAALRANVEATAAREEHTDATVEVSHILVAFEGAMRSTVKNRTEEQAEQLAADLLARVVAGEDFEAVRQAHTNDPGPPAYKLTSGPAKAGAYSRGAMAKGFGDVAWRLGVGEIGVTPYHGKTSPFGWHIVKRVN